MARTVYLLVLIAGLVIGWHYLQTKGYVHIHPKATYMPHSLTIQW